MQTAPMTLTLAVGRAIRTVLPTDIRVDLGPTHPGAAGLVLVHVEISGETGRDAVISRADVQPGFSHRDDEALFEVRDYRQVLSLADRHDWTAPAFGEVLAARAAERLLGLEPPPRARLIREVLLAHARISSHLAHLTFVPFRLGQTTLSLRIARQRERGRILLERITGNRVHPMAVRLGGVGVDPDPVWLADLVAWAEECAGVGEDLLGTMEGSSFQDVAAGVGILDAAAVDAYGLSGPISRASGVERTIRARPTPPTASGAGDAASRFAALAGELCASPGPIRALTTAFEPGPVSTQLAAVVRVPEGEVFEDIDAPMGVASVHLVSRGAATPWRMGLRTPTFANVQALNCALVGTPLDRADAVIASLGHTVGDLDK